MSNPLAACEARNAILVQTLIGLAEMVRTEVTTGRLRDSAAWTKALALADDAIAGRPVQA